MKKINKFKGIKRLIISSNNLKELKQKVIKIIKVEKVIIYGNLLKINKIRGMQPIKKRDSKTVMVSIMSL